MEIKPQMRSWVTLEIIQTAETGDISGVKDRKMTKSHLPTHRVHPRINLKMSPNGEQ
jgi:hypothetical protein